MKKFIIVVVLFALFATFFTAYAEIYPQTFVVDLINYEQNFTILVDFNDNEWVWEGIEDFNCGDIVAAIMEECGTPTIYDDKIVMIKYTGYIEGWQ